MRALAAVFNALSAFVLVVGIGLTALNGMEVHRLRSEETTDENRAKMEQSVEFVAYGLAAALLGCPMLALCGGFATSLAIHQRKPR